MPIKIENNLPAKQALLDENIFVMDKERALHQDIRPLKIVILNLMPLKQDTERQLLRLLSNSPLQVDLTLLKVDSYESKNESRDHMVAFYNVFSDIKDKKFDGMIITGAPVETMDFEEVDYWDELVQIMEWTKTSVTSTFHICWGAQAGLYYHYGINKVPLKEKMFGVFRHNVLEKRCPLLRGFDSEFYAPHSRHTGLDEEALKNDERLVLLSVSDEAGVYIVKSKDNRHIFVTGHSEYEIDTLYKEYSRDKSKGLDIKIPVNYFKDDDDSKEPVDIWRSHAHLLYSNWLNYYVYQATPFMIEDIGK